MFEELDVKGKCFMKLKAPFEEGRGLSEIAWFDDDYGILGIGIAYKRKVLLWDYSPDIDEDYWE